MDREAWQATLDGVSGVRHDLVTNPPPPEYSYLNKTKQNKTSPNCKPNLSLLKIHKGMIPLNLTFLHVSV